MVRAYPVLLFLICTACLSYVTSSCRAADPAPPETPAPAKAPALVAVPAPPYVILLRSRRAAVTPERSKNSQTGGGFIQVTQVEPNAVMFLMRGAVATRADHKDGSATMQFDLKQDFEIVPVRTGIRPPQITLSAWVIGALNTTEPEGGTAEQAPGCAAIASAEGPLLKVCVKPHAVSGRQNMLVNDRCGPLEAPVVPGGYTLHQNFALNASQPKLACRPGFACADFDPDPKLDAGWNFVLRPFRAVPHRDFGFHVLLRVVGVVAPPSIPAPHDQLLPPPTPEKIQAVSAEERVAKPCSEDVWKKQRP